MNLTLKKDEFINLVLSPASKLTDNLLLFSETQNGQQLLKTLTTSSDNTAVLLTECLFKGTGFSKLIIPEIKTFLRLFSNIDKEEVTLAINDNQIVYKDDKITFKYFLLDEEYYTSKKSLNEDKINALKYNTTFTITKQSFAEIIKYNAIIPEAEKLYLFTDDNKVYAQLGDKQKPNINEITTAISQNYQGESLTEAIPLNIQTLLLLSFANIEYIDIAINVELKVVKFSSNNLKYILSGLVK
jgi:hypothetical protein